VRCQRSIRHRFTHFALLGVGILRRVFGDRLALWIAVHIEVVGEDELGFICCCALEDAGLQRGELLGPAVVLGLGGW